MRGFDRAHKALWWPAESDLITTCAFFSPVVLLLFGLSIRTNLYKNVLLIFGHERRGDGREVQLSPSVDCQLGFEKRRSAVRLRKYAISWVEVYRETF